MEKRTQRLIASCGVIVLSICMCLSLVGVGGAALSILNRSTIAELSEEVIATSTAETAPDQVDETVESGTPQPDTRPTETDAPEETVPAEDADIPAEIARQMDEIQAQVIELRGLQPQKAVSRELLSPEQLRKKVIDDFMQDYSQEEAADDSISLAAFGLIDPDFDLINFYIELFSEQVAGFYDDEAEKMYVVQGEGFQGTERLTYAHEYVHALQDQQFDLENGLDYNDEACEEDSERCAAVQALIEGDATSLEIAWLTTYATSQDLADIQQFYNSFESPIYDSAPAFLREDFVFPYLNGQSFVEHLQDEGGWAAVNQAYKVLPLSTEQILHPDRYPDDVPIPVSLPDLSTVLGDGWQEVDSGVMGEWYTYLILAFGLDPQSRISENEARIAAEGWGGDAYAVYYNDGAAKTVMVMKTVWDTSEEVTEFATAFQAYAGKRFGPGESFSPEQMSWTDQANYSLFRLEEKESIWLLAPDKTTADAILDALE